MTSETFFGIKIRGVSLFSQLGPQNLLLCFVACYDSEFRCDNGVCILPNWVCDDKDNCGDLSDERNCGE